ncbi:hypothetical protein ACJZTR_00095 [Neorickettsia risticii]|uniref:Uncharacterized protein n=1 Tax=Neorickettsia risticii (strain Illinois) TaxID=434131 RepID=C6V3Q7_NEORI|nr:hypothetical protein [Neorickettsia risticii]ACT69024.1 conserved hypothetical protein [Neorickettsia risticii str. Illinois]
MQDGGKIPKSLKRRIEESNIIGELAAGMRTRKSSLEANQETFFNEIRVTSPSLAEFCQQNKSLLGLNDLHRLSTEEVGVQARSLVECYDMVLECHGEVQALHEAIIQAEKRMKEVSKKEKEALVADLAKISSSSRVFTQISEKIERATGINISDGFSGLMKSLGAKIAPKGNDSDPTRTLSDIDCLKKIMQAKSLSTPVTLVKAVMVAIIAPGGIPLVGAGLTMLPIVTMVWPAMVAWDVLKLPSNIVGSPFNSGNISNLVKECEAGFSSGPAIAENMPRHTSRESKTRAL